MWVKWVTCQNSHFSLNPFYVPGSGPSSFYIYLSFFFFMFYSAQQTQAIPAFGILEFVTYRTEAWSHPPARSHYSNSHLKGSQQTLN